MKKIVVLLIVLALLMAAGCGAAKETEITDSIVEDDEQQGVLNIKKIGSQIATYEGDKYIVSDGINEEYQKSAYTGLQELCVIKVSEDWESIEEEIWDRNDFQFVGVATPYGTKTFQYKYINPFNTNDVFITHDENYNELPVENPVEEYLNKTVNDRQKDYESLNGYRDSDDQISMETAEIKKTTIGEQEISYRRCDVFDSHDIVIVQSAFKKADDCVFCVSAAYDILKEDDSEVDELQLLEEAYSNISFYNSGFDSIKASSPAAKRTIVSGDNENCCIVDDSSSKYYHYNSYSTDPMEIAEGSWTVNFKANPDSTMFQSDLKYSLSFAEEEGCEIVQTPEIKGYTIDEHEIKASMLQYDRKDELAGGVAELIAWFPEGDNYFSIEYEKRTDESIREASIDEESVLKSILDKLQFKENDSNYKNDVKNKNAGGAISGGYNMEEIQAMISKAWIGERKEDGNTHLVAYFQNEDASVCGYLQQTNGSVISLNSGVGKTTMKDVPLVSKDDGQTITAKEIVITSEDGKTKTYYTYEEDELMYISFDEGDELSFVPLSPATTDEFMAKFERGGDMYDVVRVDNDPMTFD